MKTLITCLLVVFYSAASAQHIFIDTLLPPPPPATWRSARVVTTPPILNSDLASAAVILLDFDGHVVNDFIWDDSTINALPAALTQAEMVQIFNAVSDDYAQFNINVTTDEAVFNAAPTNRRERVIITPTSSWYPYAVGGLAYLGSFTSTQQEAVWVFSEALNNFPKYIAEAISHEAGHSLNLFHQSEWTTTNPCTKLSEYFLGYGPFMYENISGLGWSPIMGNSYYKIQTGWSNGTSSNSCTELQNDMTVIANNAGVGFRAPITRTHTLTNSVILTARVLPNQITRLTLLVPSAIIVVINCRSGGNTDTKIRMNGVENNQPDSLHSKLEITLIAGTHVLEISGEDNEWSPNYGSAGLVTLNIGTTPTTVVNTGENRLSYQNQQLIWFTNITGFQKLELQTSKNGSSFTTFHTTILSVGTISYIPRNGTTYLRSKATSSSGLLYSNILTLKGDKNTKWAILDLQGKVLRTGDGPVRQEGMKHGMYILQTSFGSSKIVM